MVKFLIDECVGPRVAYKIKVLKSLLQHHAQELFGNYVVATETTVRIVRPHFS